MSCRDSEAAMVKLGPALIIGPMEAGIMLSVLLFGISIAQTYTYFNKFWRDPQLLKALVLLVLSLETAHIVCVAMTQWYMTVTNYADTKTLGHLPYAAVAAFILTIIIDIFVHTYFLYRLYTISSSIIAVSACGVLVLLSGVGALVISSKMVSMKNIVCLQHDQYVLIAVAFFAEALADVAITVSLACYIRVKVRPGFDRTANIVDGLMMWILETGLFTSVLAIVVTICFLTMHNFVWIGMYTFLGNVYANVLLATLNSRLKLRRKISGAIHLKNASSSSEDTKKPCFLHFKSHSGSCSTSKITTSPEAPVVDIQVTDDEYDDDVSSVQINPSGMPRFEERGLAVAYSPRPMPAQCTLRSPRFVEGGFAIPER